MSNVTIVKGDLFDAPKGSIICHAVNCHGVWGAGIARSFKTRYPESYGYYRAVCEGNGNSLLGSCLLIHEESHTIGCLFTSSGYGSRADSNEEILEATKEAIKDLIFQNSYPQSKPIHMCKINSGLFGVPWELTQKVLEEFKGVGFTVYEL